MKRNAVRHIQSVGDGENVIGMSAVMTIHNGVNIAVLVLTNNVPLEPRVIERAFSIPDANMLMANPGGNLIEFTGISRRRAVPIASNALEIQRIRRGRIRRRCLAGRSWSWAIIVMGCISIATAAQVGV